MRVLIVEDEPANSLTGPAARGYVADGSERGSRGRRVEVAGSSHRAGRGIARHGRTVVAQAPARPAGNSQCWCSPRGMHRRSRARAESGRGRYLAKPFATGAGGARLRARAAGERCARVIEHGALLIDLDRKRASTGKPEPLGASTRSGIPVLQRGPSSARTRSRARWRARTSNVAQRDRGADLAPEDQAPARRCGDPHDRSLGYLVGPRDENLSRTLLAWLLPSSSWAPWPRAAPTSSWSAASSPPTTRTSATSRALVPTCATRTATMLLAVSAQADAVLRRHPRPHLLRGEGFRRQGHRGRPHPAFAPLTGRPSSGTTRAAAAHPCGGAFEPHRRDLRGDRRRGDHPQARKRGARCDGLGDRAGGAAFHRRRGGTLFRRAPRARSRRPAARAASVALPRRPGPGRRGPRRGGVETPGACAERCSGA